MWNSRVGLEFAVWVGIRDFRLMADGILEKQLEITKSVEFTEMAWNSAKRRGIPLVPVILNSALLF